MEFLIVAAVVAVAMFGAAVLAALGHDQTETASGLRRVVDTGFGGLLALAYAAAGGARAVRDRLTRQKDQDGGGDGA